MKQSFYVILRINTETEKPLTEAAMRKVVADMIVADGIREEVETVTLGDVIDDTKKWTENQQRNNDAKGNRR